MKCRGAYINENEPLFIFQDKSPVLPRHASEVLRKVLTSIGLKKQVHHYSMHSLHIGRTSDLIKFGYSIEEVRLLGRWHSNIVYKYITT